MAKANVLELAPAGKFAGFTDEQVRMLLERIASDANLIAEICRVEAERAGTDDHALTFLALDRMALAIGALADAPTGGNVAGGFTDWLMGPLFNKTMRGA